MYHLQGVCQFGDSCAFAHACDELQGAPDLRKTRLCKTFVDGRCEDPNCPFAHTEEELRSTDMFYKKTLCMWNEKGRCRNGDQCRFAHGFDELRAREQSDRALAAAAQGKGAGAVPPSQQWARGASGAQRRGGKTIPGEMQYTDSGAPGNFESLEYAMASALYSKHPGVLPNVPMMTTMGKKGAAPPGGAGGADRHDWEPMFVQPLPSVPLPPSSVAGMLQPPMPQVAHQRLAVLEQYEQLNYVTAQTEQLQRAYAVAAAAALSAGEADGAGVSPTELEKLSQNISALSMQLSRFEQQMSTPSTGSDPVPSHMKPGSARIAPGMPNPYSFVSTW
jgi:hypothetical protein